jgi:hypothetical protein
MVSVRDLTFVLVMASLVTGTIGLAQSAHGADWSVNANLMSDEALDRVDAAGFIADSPKYVIGIGQSVVGANGAPGGPGQGAISVGGNATGVNGGSGSGSGGQAISVGGAAQGGTGGQGAESFSEQAVGQEGRPSVWAAKLPEGVAVMAEVPCSSGGGVAPAAQPPV